MKRGTTRRKVLVGAAATAGSLALTAARRMVKRAKKVSPVLLPRYTKRDATVSLTL